MFLSEKQVNYTDCQISTNYFFFSWLCLWLFAPIAEYGVKKAKIKFWLVRTRREFQKWVCVYVFSTVLS